MILYKNWTKGEIELNWKKTYPCVFSPLLLVATIIGGKNERNQKNYPTAYQWNTSQFFLFEKKLFNYNCGSQLHMP